ncbi:U2 snRNP complex subunit [Saccharomycopsis crataegensis]|uniref:U2 snRNP complex subunit n=1 Tax=Saccharomycopsis crataegensis TaxID=43959 RepID=A0AAV5QVW9_9ASCO|nr:U2 snRNP complex subunit [Saccharomycopsis crataegensis]
MTSVEETIESLPRSIENFKTIDKIYFDQVKRKWYFEDPETEIELIFDEVQRKWFEETPNAFSKKREYPNVEEDEEKKTIKELRLKKKQKIKQMKDEEKESRQNTKKITSVYVSNLPKDITKDELEKVFGKFGVLAEDLINNTGKRIKIYTDNETNEVKGDALVVYHRSESVDLATDMLDDSYIRPGVKIRVQKADFENYGKKQGERKQISDEVRKKISKMSKKLDEKIDDWDDEEELKKEQRQKYLKRYEKIAVLKGCFAVSEIEDDPEVVEDIKEDMMEECEKFGEVVQVTVYDKEQEGIVLVKFTNREAVELCISQLNGRYFGGQQLEVFVYDGKPYQSSQLSKDGDVDDEKRLKDYEEFLKSGSSIKS